MARAVTVSVTKVLMRPARAAPTTAFALSMPTAIPITCGMRRSWSVEIASSCGSSA
jgi:hypothetical protein